MILARATFMLLILVTKETDSERERNTRKAAIQVSPTLQLAQQRDVQGAQQQFYGEYDCITPRQKPFWSYSRPPSVRVLGWSISDYDCEDHCVNGSPFCKCCMCMLSVGHS